MHHFPVYLNLKHFRSWLRAHGSDYILEVEILIRLIYESIQRERVLSDDIVTINTGVSSFKDQFAESLDTEGTQVHSSP